MCATAAPVCQAGGTCRPQSGLPPSSPSMKDALFADIVADDAFNLLQVNAKLQRGKAKGKSNEVGKAGKEAAVLQLAADALTVAGASAELLADAGKTVAEMATEMTEESVGKAHKSAGSPQRVDGTFKRVLQEVEDDAPTRKEAALEAVETLSTADSLMRLWQNNFKLSAAILVADGVLLLGLLFCCKGLNGFLRCCCPCRAQSKMKSPRRAPDLDSLVAWPAHRLKAGGYGGCSVNVPQSVHYGRAMSQLMIDGVKLDENGVPKNLDGHRLQSALGADESQGKMAGTT